MSIRRAVLTFLKEILQTALISLGIFFFVYIFLVQPHRIKGDSMAPNFADGELLLTEKISYRLYPPQRGDVVVFRAPGTRKVDFIKRIVGLPNDTIKIEDGQVFVNGQSLEEPYETQKTQGKIEKELSQNQYFVLGDNRSSSSDSRNFGPVGKELIVGRVWLVYWPVFPTNKARGARIISRIDYDIPNTFDNPSR